MELPHGGVSVTFMSASIATLTRQHGSRLMSPDEHTRGFLSALAAAENHFKQLLREQRPARRRKPKPGA